MDPISESKRTAAISEARRLYPQMSPVLAGWVYDYIENMGEEEFLRRAKEGFYETKSEKLLEE
tara:strand:+ start:173 stop:361 length:189 start_codon:yes stop_codon:yes gene_type:complete